MHKHYQGYRYWQDPGNPLPFLATAKNRYIVTAVARSFTLPQRLASLHRGNRLQLHTATTARIFAPRLRSASLDLMPLVQNVRFQYAAYAKMIRSQ